jgi:transcriptional repressor NrdR
MVVKRDGRREVFAKDKLLSGLRKACQKRPISPQTIAELVDRITVELHDQFEGEVPSLAIGERVMNELQALDAVAYVRFPSVYRRFEEAADFLQAVKKLEVRRDTLTYRLPGF